MFGSFSAATIFCFPLVYVVFLLIYWIYEIFMMREDEPNEDCEESAFKELEFES
jgi:hypothetical protein